MWFIGVEVEQGTSAPPPKKNPGSAPDLTHTFSILQGTRTERKLLFKQSFYFNGYI